VLIAVTISGTGVFLIVLALGVWYIARRSQRNQGLGEIQLLDDETVKLMLDHVPTTLQFRNVSYRIGEKQILDNIHGIVKPGEVLAIMGASGAGKTSFLDILARKRKKGIVEGDFFLNGRTVTDSQFKRVVGFVDQDNMLMPSLTVYETVLYSALLRLPKDMSVQAKKYRVLETLEELGIHGIKDTKIGNEGERGISGGEKRRVAIACELVTSPSILFMDEPVFPFINLANADFWIGCL
jgi:ABC-type multidrug transport system ATPase subunit